MKLVIVESPTKAKTISKFLPKEYHVKSSMGHVRDLPKSKMGVDFKHDFRPKYVIPPKKKKKVSELKKDAKKADEIILATDPDREGEAIAWHLLKTLDLDEKKTSVDRIVFHEITDSAVENALKHPREIDKNLLHAQEARRVLDRLVGYQLSELIWKKVRYGLSAGRVQSPALRLIVGREKEIQAFNPEDYWVITADVKKDGEVFTLECSEEIWKKKEVDTILEVGKKSDWQVDSVKKRKQKRNPYAPFKTSTLQQAASTRLGFSPARTMRVAQKLYEAGLITYMRTDSLSLAKSAQAQIIGQVEKRFGKDYVKPRSYKTKSKTAQEAHEAIRPTNVSKKAAGKNASEKKLYDLIWKQTVSSQMKSAEIIRTKAVVRVGNEKEVPEFTIHGSQTIFAGWLKAYPEARGDDVEIPDLEEGDQLSLEEMHVEDKQTQPPRRYTEAGLIKELEKRGIGRPSTYASIIHTLEKRGYVNKEKRSLIPTDTGMVVSDFLEENFTKYVSDSFTADMEDRLDDIAAGDRSYTETIKGFYEPFSKHLEEKKDMPKITTLGDVPEKYPCPECGAKMVYKLGRNGIFMSCSKFPDCKGARTKEGEAIEDDKPIGKHPDTGENIYVLHGPYGPYVQLGEKKKGKKKPKRASIPKDKDPSEVTIDDAVKYLSLPRVLGKHPESGKDVVASIGRYGPYVMHDGDFRSLKEDDVYSVSFDRAMEILSQPKKRRGGRKKKKKKKAKKKKASSKKSKKDGKKKK